MMYKQTKQLGAINPLIIFSSVLGVLVIVFGALAVWAYTNYSDQKNNVDAKVATAVADAKKQQSDSDQAKYLEEEKQPYVQFKGPAELGSVTFDYPKTWSVYVDKSTSDSLEAYLQPGVVPSLTSNTPYATRVTITSRNYSDSLKEYNDLIKTGKLKSSAISVDGQNGTRLDGNFTKDIQGSMVIFQIRNQTLKVYTQSPTFMTDFEQAVLASLKFNP